MKMIALGLALLLSAQPAPEADPATPTAIEAASFLEGRWVGTGLGGDVEEMWSPAVGGQMVGHFSYAKDGKPVFYEILLLRPDRDGEGLEMLVKHFNADFTAWEDKEEWVTFEAYAVGPGQVIQMKGLRLELVEEVLTATLTMRQKNGTVEDVPFVMRRAP